MAQWQRVGFQTQRLGVRIPLASHPFFAHFFCNRQFKQKKSAPPKLGIAPRLPRPQRGVLLLDYFGSRRALEDPGIDPGSQPCEGCMLPCTTIPRASIGTRTRILSLEGINTTLVLWTLRMCARSHWLLRARGRNCKREKKSREGRFELPTKGSLRTQMHTLQSSALPLSYPRCAPCIPPV